MDEPRGAAGLYVPVRDGYEVLVEHVVDPRADFHLATIRRVEDGVHRSWGVVAWTREEVLVAAGRRIEELIALRNKETGTQPIVARARDAGVTSEPQGPLARQASPAARPTTR